MPSPLPSTGTLPETWRVRLPIFEGPLDLLLDLIRLNEVEITDIPVALVCDQFHQYLQWMEELDLDIAGDYIYMAAYLIHLKSKMLLPRPKTLNGEEIAEDPRQDLVERLLEYRRLKEAAQTLAELDSVRRGMWIRQSDEMRRIGRAGAPEMDISELSLYDLLRTFKDVIERFRLDHPEPFHVTGETYSVRGQVERLLEFGRTTDHPWPRMMGVLLLATLDLFSGAFVDAVEKADESVRVINDPIERPVVRLTMRTPSTTEKGVV